MTTVAIAAGILLFNAAIYGLIILIGHALGPPVRPLPPAETPPRSV
jgi:hypothetical protein